MKRTDWSTIWPLLLDEFTKSSLFTTINETKKLDKHTNATEIYRLNKVMPDRFFMVVIS